MYLLMAVESRNSVVSCDVEAEPVNGARDRQAGVLLHPTSLPGSAMQGTLGEHAHRFVDLMSDAGVQLWQMLPLGPVHEDLSPYMSVSAHAGNPLLIDIAWLQRHGWLGPVDRAGSHHAHIQHVRDAFDGFQSRADPADHGDYQDFVARHAGWLEDYALYLALREHFEHRAWTDWPQPLRDREPAALAQARSQLADAVARIRFEQYVFYRQWHELRAHATARGMRLIGDMPLFVAHDSADVWVHRRNFLLDAQGRPMVVAGVPPDCFSETGQRWGNPHFDWDYMQADGFRWWTDRVRSNMELFDIVRVDHFRGFVAVWQIPADSETAVDGQWVEVPGESLFDHLLREFGRLPFIAEDLGIITSEVVALRERYHLPGMKILQFAFDGDENNPYLPQHHERNCVVYTGTHDNDTTLGWYRSLDERVRANVLRHIGSDADMPWPLIDMAMQSPAEMAVVPMQDVLGLGSEARMNIPGRTTGNWRWRFDWSLVGNEQIARLARSIDEAGR